MPAPRLPWEHDADEWVALVFDHIDGRQPQAPWRMDELRAVIAALERLTEGLTPSPIDAPSIADSRADAFTGWRRLAADPPPVLDSWSRPHLSRLAALEPAWVDGLAGDTLLHTDIRADNLLIDSSRKVCAVDWPNACRGAGWIDVVFMAPSVELQGGPEPEPLLGMTSLTRGADHEAITAGVVALAGYFTERGTLPDPPGLPTLRAFQRAQGEIARRWMAQRLGWE